MVLDLVQNQLASGWDVSVACPPAGDLAAAVGRAGGQVLSWPASREVGMAVPAEIGRLATALRGAASDPELVHLHSAKAGLVGRLVLRGQRPTVFQPHAWSFEAASGWMRAAAVRWERHGARWTHRIVCGSAQERERGVTAGVPARCVVVPNGVDLSRFTAADGAARRAARASLGLDRAGDREAPLAVCIGRLCRQKGQDILLAAWRLVTAILPAARLVLIGDGPDRARLAAGAPPGVRLAGPAADPRPWYAAADLVVLPSRWEGAPLVLLEAMASARCVVATDVGGAAEALPAAGTAVVPVGDPVALADAVADRLRCPDLAAAEAAAGYARVRATYDVRHTAAQVSELYREVIGQRSG